MTIQKFMILVCIVSPFATTVARADDLSKLKMQIQALQSRVSDLEAQSQASIPSGYSLLSIRDGQGVYHNSGPERYADRVREDSGFTLSVLPTADAAPAAEVSVSGEIRTALLYTDRDDTGDSLDVVNRGRIFVRGKVDTAVGEVGGYFRLEASGGGNFSDYSENTRMNKAWGYWKFAPGWELMAGYNNNTGGLQTSYDWMVSSIPARTVGPASFNNEQLRLTYTSGPFAIAFSVEDPDGTSGDVSDLPNAQAYARYSSDSLTAQAVGLIQDDDYGATDWAIGGGATLGIAESFRVLAAAVLGEGTSSYANHVRPGSADDDFWAASGGVIADLSEDTRLELGVGYEDYDLGGQALGINGGFFWDPVSQVTVGLGATWVDYGNEAVDDFEDYDQLQVYLGTWLRFP